MVIRATHSPNLHISLLSSPTSRLHQLAVHLHVQDGGSVLGLRLRYLPQWNGTQRTVWRVHNLEALSSLTGGLCYLGRRPRLEEVFRRADKGIYLVEDFVGICGDRPVTLAASDVVVARSPEPRDRGCLLLVHLEEWRIHY